MATDHVAWLRVYGSDETGHSAMTKGERARLRVIATELDRLQKENAKLKASLEQRVNPALDFD